MRFLAFFLFVVSLSSAEATNSIVLYRVAQIPPTPQPPNSTLTITNGIAIDRISRMPSATVSAANALTITNGITVGEVVACLGPGWMPLNESVGIIRWNFSDGRQLNVRLETWDAGEILSSDSSARSRFWFTVNAGGRIPYTDCRLSVTNRIFHLDPLPNNRMFNSVLDRCAIEPGRSTYESYFVSGRVVSNNSGGPIEGVAISVRAPGQALRLVAITDTDGSFRFTVWINSKPQPALGQQPALEPAIYTPVVLPSIVEGDLCLGGVFGPNRLMVSGIVARYSFGDLNAAPKKPTSEK